MSGSALISSIPNVHKTAPVHGMTTESGEGGGHDRSAISQVHGRVQTEGHRAVQEIGDQIIRKETTPITNDYANCCRQEKDRSKLSRLTQGASQASCCLGLSKDIVDIDWHDKQHIGNLNPMLSSKGAAAFSGIHHTVPNLLSK